jgi:hypothetical protein
MKALNVEIFFGNVNFSVSAQGNGFNERDPLVVQIVRGHTDIILPKGQQTADLVYPSPLSQFILLVECIGLLGNIKLCGELHFNNCSLVIHSEKNFASIFFLFFQCSH